MDTHWGARLRQVRTARGLSQEALAHRALVSMFTISRTEREAIAGGKRLREPYFATVEKIARVLEVDPVWLLRGEGVGPAAEVA